MKRLITNQRRLFWTFQITGWLAFFLLYYLGGKIHGKAPEFLYVSVFLAAVGFVLTLGLRLICKSVWEKPLPWQLGIALLGTIACSLIFAPLSELAFVWFYPTNWRPSTWVDYFSGFTYSAYVFLSWTGLYFGIKYYRMLQHQTERALKANAVAHQAQLKMLRYQLNPHFLFNTLNAISTLILEKDTRTANKMVTKLSEFLRHSLDSDPEARVTLKQELEALNLYLSIEKLRFDDRLGLEFDVDSQCQHALVPSLILQPLIENAIKYAVGNREQGGTIAIHTRCDDGMLEILVRDNGPGADLEKINNGNGRGVGLANIRERLQVLYGENQSFSVRNGEKRGLIVTMKLPYETSGTAIR